MDRSPAQVALPTAPLDHPAHRGRAAARRGNVDVGLFLSLWKRDLLRLKRESSRWIGVVAQPLLLWLLLGSGMSSVFTVEGLGELDYFRFFFPGLLVMVVLFTTIFATMAVIEDRQSGFLQQVLTAPGSRAAMVLGKTAGVVTVAFIQIALTLLVAPAAGFSLTTIAWPELLAAFLLGSVALTALSFVMAWLISSTHGYHALMAVLLLPLWLVSGAMFPPQSGWLDIVMTINPMTYMVDGFRHALHGGSAPVAFTDQGTALLVLSGVALVGTMLAIQVASRSNGVRR